MATNFSVGRTIECWKKHACAGCGGEYRYKFVRKLTAQGNSERAALDALNKKIDSAVGAEVDLRPCPTCGRVQADMIGQEKSTAHTVIAVLAVVLVIAPIVLGATYVIRGNLPTFIVAGILGLAAVLQVLVAIENHNRNAERNIEKAGKFLDDGTMQPVTAGDTANGSAAPALLRPGVLVGLAIIAAAVAVALAPAGYQMMNGLVFNADTKPDVVSPGDEVKVYFPTKIDCVKSNWRSISVENAIKNMPAMPKGNLDLSPDGSIFPYHPPTATIANAAELGIPNKPLTASSSKDTWGSQFNVKNSQKHTHPWIWATATVPDDDKLVGKTIQLEVEMDILFPKVEGNQFNPHIETNVKQTFSLTIAKKGEGTTYATIWWVGLCGGTVLSLIGGLVLRGSNKALKNSVPPPAVEVDDDDEPADDGEEPKETE